MELKHLERMIPWLRKLASSIHGLLPEALGSKSNLPPLKAVWEWVDSLTLKAFEVIERHTITAEGLERLELYDIQAAIIARLVCARDMPCIRLAILQSLLLPGVNISCPRKYCKRSGCLGNQMLLQEEEDGSISVRLYCPHHKNEDKQGPNHADHPLDIILPQGPLTSLLLYWIKAVPLLTKDPLVFFSRASPPLPYNSNTFTNYWKAVMKSFKGKSFAPSLGRSIFVDEATTKMDESTWDRMASVMGSSARMWRQTYAHTLRRRQMQGGVEVFTSFSSLVMGEEGSSAPASLPSCLSLSLARPPALSPGRSGAKRKEFKAGGRLYSGLRSVPLGEESSSVGVGASSESEDEIRRGEVVVGLDDDDDLAFGWDGGWACV
jgi:hypothetical protein